MTEKQYRMINTNLADENGRIYYNIQRNDGVNICQVYGKNNAKSLIDELNELHEQSKENDRIANDLLESKEQLEDDTSIIMLMELKKENKKLKDKLFEAEKDYLIETADISDKLYLDEEIRKLKKEVYGDFE